MWRVIPMMIAVFSMLAAQHAYGQGSTGHMPDLNGYPYGSSVDADASTDDTDDTIDEAIQEGQLAQAAGIPPCNLICGDPSGDGAVTVTDSVLAQNYAAGLGNPTLCQQYAADVNSSGAVTVTDAVLIGQAAQGPLELTCKPGWLPTFSDEFNGTTLDTSKWNTLLGGSHTPGTNHGELQYYTDDSVTLSGGVLHLTGARRLMQGFNYTSGVIATEGKFSQLYGYFEIKAKVPAGNGFWPAFWMLPPTLWAPETDILEMKGSNPSKNYMTNHWSGGSNGGTYTGPNFSTSFHTFGVAWSAGSLTWYIDDVQRFQSTSHVSSVPMYLIANLAIGGTFPGNPDSSTPFPSSLDIDYIRAYRVR